MGFHLFRSKDKNTSSELSSHHSTKTSGPAVARTAKGGSGTYADTGGRAAASTRHGDAWSQSIAYGGDPTDSGSSSRQVSKKKETHTYTSGNALAGVIDGGSYAWAGKGGYAEAAYRDGSKYGTSIAYGVGGKMKQGAIRGGSNSRGGRIESSHHYDSSDAGEDSDY